MWSVNVHYCIDIAVTSSFILVESCPVLTTMNGNVTYAPEGIPPVVNAVATYTCNDDYVLDGMSTSTCGNGTWTGSAPVCLREYSTIYKPCSLTLVSMSDSSEMKTLLHYYIYSW